VTTTVDKLPAFNEQLTNLLAQSGIAEFKWKSLKGSEEREAAKELCRFAVDQACKGALRVDVLIWDTEDSRHKVPLRDDIANLQRMYYHLFRNVLRLRWPNDAIWRLHPDEHTAMDWDTVQDCLESVSTRVEMERSLFTQGTFRPRLRSEFGIEQIQPVPSSQHSLLQLADLFAGLAVFSREKFPKYQEWLSISSAQMPLMSHAQPADTSFSRSEKERFQVLSEFNQMCKQRKLGVSLESKEGLWTPDPRNPINFWPYEPQHPEDKAPTRK